MLESATNAVTGYFTLAAASIPFDRIPETTRKRARLSRYPELSAILIARLARHAGWRGEGLGELLLAEAISTSYRATADVGAAFILVDSADQSASDFYERFGFTALDDSRRLFMPMATVKDLVRPSR